MPQGLYLKNKWKSAVGPGLARSASWGLVLILFVAFGPLIRMEGTPAPPSDASLPASSRSPSTLPSGELFTLRGNTRPEAMNPANDRGRVSDDLPLPHLLLQLQRTPQQEQALEQFIGEIHDPQSPLFHHWISAAEFGQTYGVAPADVARVTTWLVSQGFQVNLVYPSQMLIDFSGTAGQIRQAFHTEIHNLSVNGQAHIANMSDPQIPLSLASVIAGPVSLNDFRPQPMYRLRDHYTAGDGIYLIVPGDLWTIYNFGPAFTANYSGQGQTITILQDSDLYSTTDWSTFRSTLGIASVYPNGSLTTVHPPSSPVNNCEDSPADGTTSLPGADGEAAIDVEWSSAAAPNAAIQLAVCADTETNFGGFIALQNLLNSDAPPAITSLSFGDSESLDGSIFLAYINGLYQLGVTEGVSLYVSSGDSGAAATDRLLGLDYDEYGITVSGYASTPNNVAVGGTDFADSYQGTNGTYWNSLNAANFSSALSYIPEIPWNSSCASALIADYFRFPISPTTSSLCNYTEARDDGFLNIVGGAGGPSGCATGAADLPGAVSGTCAGYPKPSWQAGLVGNPSDGVRDLPDLSLFAATGFWGHIYVFCFTDSSNGGTSCSGVPDTWAEAGGTSFASPIMAGVQALLNEATGGRAGNPNYAFYALAKEEYGTSGSSTCASSLGNTIGSSCVFNDVVPIPFLYGNTGSGGDNDMPCFGMNCYSPAPTNTSIAGVLSTAPQSMTEASVTSIGTGAWTSPPTCTLSGGGGSGATCAATITGVVSNVNLTAAGSGYTFSSSGPNCNLTGGGVGAQCEVDQLSETGAVTQISVTAFGAGYTSAPTCTITGGGGSGATCTATYDASGITLGITNGGSGYSTLPQCVLSGGTGGTGAACSVQAVNTSTSYQPAFITQTGWDFPTGIGTVNVSNLVSSFTSNTASLSSSGLDFSAAPGSTSAAQNATLTNTGTGSMIILSDSITGTDAGDYTKTADTCAGATLAHNQSCSVSLTFTAPSMGTFDAALNFTDIAPHSPQSVSLTGTGAQPTPVASLSANSLTFQPVPVGSTSTQPVTLSNTGTNSLALSGITVSGYFAQTNNCGPSLSAGANCTINVTFQPRGPGASTGALTVSDNASGSPQTVALNGTGVVFTAGPNPPVIAPLPTVPQPGNPSPAPKADPLKGKPIKEEPIGQTPPKSD